MIDDEEEFPGLQNALQEFFNHDLNEEFLQEHNQRAVQLGNNVPVARTNNILTNGNRQLIVEALRNGTATIASLSATFQVDKRTIRRLWNRFNETGTSEKKKQGGYKRK